MFAKCLKYELRAILKFFIIASVVLLGISVIGSVTVRLLVAWMENDTENTAVIIGTIVLVLLLLFAVATIAMYLIVTPILLAVRYYRHFFSDEGYLTFTLPVKRGTLYFSQITGAAIWTTASAVVLVGALLIAYAIIKPVLYNENLIDLRLMLQSASTFFRDFISEQIGGWIVPIIALGILILFAYTVCQMARLYFCITIGSVLVKKHKFLLSVGIYYGINMVLSIIFQFAPLLSELAAFSISDRISALDPAVHSPLIVCGMLIVFGIISAIAVAYHLVSLSILERKLNLE